MTEEIAVSIIIILVLAGVWFVSDAFYRALAALLRAREGAQP